MSQAAGSGRGPLPPPTQTHLECPWLRGAGGREGAPSGTRPPAPWCSLRFRPHGSGWTRLGGAGRSRRRGQALGAGKGTPRRGGQLPRRGVSSRLSAHAGGESQSHNFILVLPRACPPPPPSPPPVIGSQRAHSSSPPPPPTLPLQLHSSKSLGVATPGFTFSFSPRRPGVRPSRRRDARGACSGSHPFP